MQNERKHSGSGSGSGSGQPHMQTNRMIHAMCHYGRRQLNRMNSWHVFVQALIAGSFMTLGALLSVLMAVGGGTTGTQTVLLGVGLSAALFFMVMTNAFVFSDNSVMLPGSLYRCTPLQKVMLLLRFWVVVWIGNFIGAFVIGWLVYAAQFYTPNVVHTLQQSVMRDLAYQQLGVVGWWQVMLSGVLASWLIGFALQITVVGRNAIDKYVPLLFAALLLAAGGFQYAPVNMGYFSLLLSGHMTGWGDAFWWNLFPASIGNIIGGAALVSAPMWLLARKRR